MTQLAYIEADDLLYDLQSITYSLIEATLPILWSISFIKDKTKPRGNSLSTTIYPFFKEFYDKCTSKDSDNNNKPKKIFSSSLFKCYLKKNTSQKDLMTIFWKWKTELHIQLLSKQFLLSDYRQNWLEHLSTQKKEEQTNSSPTNNEVINQQEFKFKPIFSVDQKSDEMEKISTLEEAWTTYFEFFKTVLTSLCLRILKAKIGAHSLLANLHFANYKIFIHSDFFSIDELNIVIHNLGFDNLFTVCDLRNLTPNDYDKAFVFSRYSNTSAVAHLEKICTYVAYAPLKDSTMEFPNDVEDINWPQMEITPTPTPEYPFQITFGKIVKSRDHEIWNSCLEFKSPVYIDGTVISGFGRGSTLLGIPTANVDTPKENLQNILPGVYYGWCFLEDSKHQHPNNSNIYKMVMSIGFNPYFENLELSVEPHIFNNFSEPFYESKIHLCIIAMLRCEADFTKFGHLLKAIQLDCDVARLKLSDANEISEEN